MQARRSVLHARRVDLLAPQAIPRVLPVKQGRMVHLPKLPIASGARLVVLQGMWVLQLVVSAKKDSFLLPLGTPHASHARQEHMPRQRRPRTAPAVKQGALRGISALQIVRVANEDNLLPPPAAQHVLDVTLESSSIRHPRQAAFGVLLVALLGTMAQCPVSCASLVRTHLKLPRHVQTVLWLNTSPRLHRPPVSSARKVSSLTYP